MQGAGAFLGTAGALLGFASGGDVVEMEDAMIGAGPGGKSGGGAFEVTKGLVGTDELEGFERDGRTACGSEGIEDARQVSCVVGAEEVGEGLGIEAGRVEVQPASEGGIGVTQVALVMEDGDGVGGLFNEGAEVGNARGTGTGIAQAD